MTGLCNTHWHGTDLHGKTSTCVGWKPAQVGKQAMTGDQPDRAAVDVECRWIISGGEWFCETHKSDLASSCDARFNAERARAEAAEKAHMTTINVLAETEAEVKRLREALREIAGVSCGIPGHSVAVGCKAASMARAALAGKEPK